MKILFSLNDLNKIYFKYDKSWFYRYCVPESSRKLENGIENLYSVETVRKTIERKRDELKKNTHVANKLRKSAEQNMNRLEKNLNILCEIIQSKTKDQEFEGIRKDKEEPAA